MGNIRQQRSVGEFPDELSIEISVDNTTISLTLHRNYHVNHQVPVTVERNGNIISHGLQDDQVFFFTRTLAQHVKKLPTSHHIVHVE